MTPPVPAEWSPHRAMWVGWPSHGELWEDNLEPAQAEVETLVRALAGPGRERVRLMVGKPEALADARKRFAGVDGSAYIIGGFGMTALTANDIVLVPIRSGLGLRLGANIGYLKFTPQATWNPF